MPSVAPGLKWIRSTPASDGPHICPKATADQGPAGSNDLVLVRVGDTIHAMHAVCAHAGGPLAEGTVVDGCVECPWHGSRFGWRTAGTPRPDGLRPAGVRDPPAESGGYEVRRAATDGTGLVTRIVVADPSLIVLVGAARLRKSTFAARHFAPAEILSSDAYRALIAGDETDQRATKSAFGRLHRELRQRLAAGSLSVVDATNIEPPPGAPS
jgi:nitrite reductase/ring-hydroxylating ferredoxin subunit